MSASVSVIFVCLGNICRSPTAHGVFQKYVNEASLSGQIYVDSAGTGDWHLGKPPDSRAQTHALRRGYDLSNLRARRFRAEDFEKFDYLLAMDSENFFGMKQFQPAGFQGHFSLFLDFLDRGEGLEVPDPYYGGDQGFENVLDMVEKASANLLQEIRRKHLGSAD